MAPYDVLVDPQTLPNLPKDGDNNKPTTEDAKDTDKSSEVCTEHRSNVELKIKDKNIICPLFDLYAIHFSELRPI